MFLKRSDLLLITFTILSFLMLSCANTGTPTGGPKDSIPPDLLDVQPPNLTTSFNNKEIELVFDEFIKVKQIKRNLIINPNIEEWDYDIRKRTLTLIIEDTLLQNTTYTFNFGGSVQDITEGNLADNLILAYSTGSYIDSLQIRGTVKDQLTNEAIEKAVVALLPVSDTVNLLEQKPLYFGTTDPVGQYELNYLKPGTYILYAFTDLNNNLIIDSKKEKYGFKGAPITLDTINRTFNLSLYKENYNELKLLSARASGHYFEIKYNKGLKDITFQSADKLPAYHITTDPAEIRFYPYQFNLDSLQVVAQAYDSADFTTIDTFSIQFQESKRDYADFKTSLFPPNNSKIKPDTLIQIRSNKPIITVNPSKFTVFYDSTYQTDVDTLYYDSLARIIHAGLRIKLDSLLINTEPNQTTNRLTEGLAEKYKSFKLILDTAAYISIDNDTSDLQQATYSILNQNEFGILEGYINCDTPVIVQLIDKNYELQSVQNTRNYYRFQLVKPGDYFIRLVIDQNKNHRYDDGDIGSLTEPEPVLFYHTPISIKANWIVQNDTIVYLPGDKRVENLKKLPWKKE